MRLAALKKPKAGSEMLRSMEPVERTRYGRSQCVPQRAETKTLHFVEKHAFREIGSPMLSLAQEQCHPDGPLTLVLLRGVDGFLPLESFERTPEGFETAQTAGR
ncbi:hypothetical protein BB934_38925 (plasmid) [Microvirga ossetica]|uniref:Uncharacterized protein n=1 Tax=Microvirga ossetica TaxID=1882682 RepID=A0A1B2EW76_9HYPH|nr:hypothetical protein BB934_38925 [Microvirga ossetica]